MMKSAYLLTFMSLFLFGHGLEDANSSLDKKLCECKIECPLQKCLDGAVEYKEPAPPCSCSLDNCPFCAFMIKTYGCCNYIPGSHVKTNGIRRICESKNDVCWEGRCMPKYMVPCPA
ncbi:uncharacterized protein LOC120349474 [Nilaparvata lugens]|uniref:uncharacterized protein LOC120349474 n=1 Tax=Nilaparvata lugens TaxID=108931 RepID=UPI00193EBD9E|nr:uncharacterized protein LOC120349474 [Nilaparvata lugens]